PSLPGALPICPPRKKKSSGRLPNSPTSKSAAGFTAVSANWRPPSANSSPPTTKPPSLSFGPKPPTKSSPASLATRNALSPPNPGNLSHEPLGQETRESGRLHLSGWSANWTCGPDGSQTGNPSRLMVHHGLHVSECLGF